MAFIKQRQNSSSALSEMGGIIPIDSEEDVIDDIFEPGAWHCMGRKKLLVKQY